MVAGIFRTEQADTVIIARDFLRDPYWPFRAARELDQSIAWPVQYLRAAPKGAQPWVPVDLKSFNRALKNNTAFRNNEVLLSNALCCGSPTARQPSGRLQRTARG